MIISGARKQYNKRAKVEEHHSDDEVDDEDSESDSEYSSEYSSDGNVKSDSDCDKDNARKKLLATWRGLCPPIQEEELVEQWYVEQWYAVAYKGRKREVLHVAKVLMRFLKDKGEPVDKIKIRCLA